LINKGKLFLEKDFVSWNRASQLIYRSRRNIPLHVTCKMYAVLRKGLALTGNELTGSEISQF